MTGIASRGQIRMSFLRVALVTVPALVLAGSLSGRLSNSGYSNIWFAALEKPDFMPPGWAFGAAWTTLYILLGFALAMLIHARGAHWRRPALILFLVQLAVNFAWSPIFFAFHQIEAALVMILVMIGLSVAAAVLAWGIRRAITLLMIPYLAWLCFAAALTVEIDRLNPNASALVSPASSSDIPISNIN
jgi:benzodiazapine receptor